MSSSSLLRVGVCMTRRNGVMIKRLSHRDSKWLDCQIRRTVTGEQYPEVKKLQLPSNMRDMPNSEEITFSKPRTRDIAGNFISAVFHNDEIVSVDHGCDSRIGKYNCGNAVDLSSSMQSNVPQPFASRNKPTHLNMPGGQLRQQAKYLSEQLNNLHPSNNVPVAVQERSYIRSDVVQSSAPKMQIAMSMLPKRNYSTDAGKGLTMKEKLKTAVKEYGGTVMVLHITISLANLGICYLLVSSGVDLKGIIESWGWSEGAATAGSVGPFLIAYAVHKAMAPLRISLALALTPIVVRFLRKRGFKLKGKSS